MSDPVRVKVEDLLKIDNFDPLKVDMSEIIDLSRRVPDSGIIDLAVAHSLAAQFLHGYDRCSELLAQSTRWHGLKLTEKNKAKAEATLIRADEKGYGKTQGSRESYALMDEQFMEASNKESIADTWRRYLEDKMELFIKWHHLAKSIADQSAIGQRTFDQGFNQAFNTQYNNTGE